MTCTKCNQVLALCACDDLETRLLKALDCPHIALRFCVNCEKYADRCRCDKPEHRQMYGSAILSMKPGAKAVYLEDGDQWPVEVVETHRRGFFVHVTLRGTPQCSTEEFSVCQRLDYPGGCWSLEAA